MINNPKNLLWFNIMPNKNLMITFHFYFYNFQWGQYGSWWEYQVPTQTCSCQGFKLCKISILSCRVICYNYLLSVFETYLQWEAIEPWNKDMAFSFELKSIIENERYYDLTFDNMNSALLLVSLLSFWPIELSGWKLFFL